MTAIVLAALAQATQYMGKDIAHETYRGLDRVDILYRTEHMPDKQRTLLLLDHVRNELPNTTLGRLGATLNIVYIGEVQL